MELIITSDCFLSLEHLRWYLHFSALKVYNLKRKSYECEINGILWTTIQIMQHVLIFQ
jgi:hypothetical protein